MLTRGSPDACPTRCLYVGLVSPSTRPAPQRPLPHKKSDGCRRSRRRRLRPAQVVALDCASQALKLGRCLQLGSQSPPRDFAVATLTRPLCSGQRREPAALGRHLGTAPKSRPRCREMSQPERSASPRCVASLRMATARPSTALPMALRGERAWAAGIVASGDADRAEPTAWLRLRLHHGRGERNSGSTAGRRRLGLNMFL